MSVDNFIPEIWSRDILYTLKKSHVGASIVNRNYQGEITSEGDTVKIQTPDSVNVGNYDGSDIDFQDPTSATQSLVIDQAKYFALLFDDVDQAQANISLNQTYMQEATFALADVTDTHILNKYIDADTDNVIGPTALTGTNIYTQTVDAKKRLSLQNVPSMGRWIVFSPDEIALLEDSDEFTSASDLGDSIKRTGFAGRISGLEVFESNNVNQTGNVRNNVFGYNGAITFADQIVSVKAGEAEKRFAEFVKGLHVYGCKTVRPKALGALRNALAS